MKNQERNLEAGNLHLLRDQQGKIYLGTKESFGFLSLSGQPLLYGYKDLGTVEQLVVKLAQYQHAARILQTSVKNQILSVLALFQEIEK